MIRPIDPPLGLPWLLYGMLGCSLALNAVLAWDRGEAECPEAAVAREPVAAEASAEPAGAPESAVAAPAPAEEPAPAAVAATASPGEAAAPTAAAPALGNWVVTTGTVEHSLARTFQEADPEHGDALAAVYSRLFVWDLDLRRDLQRGDEVEVAWRQEQDGTYTIAAARLHSHKLGRTLTAYRWQATGDRFPSYWQEEGTEVPYRLVDGPLDDYEQVTSLLKDRPHHKGMDFKTPVGTPVKAPRNAVVTRENWRWTANGNCLELRYEDGTIAKFLHLSENEAHPGDRVTAGQVIARTGNTGHSTAPHLHYQLEKGDRVVDPLDYHQVERRRLPAGDMAAFQAEVARYDALLGQALASR